MTRWPWQEFDLDFKLNMLQTMYFYGTNLVTNYLYLYLNVVTFSVVIVFSFIVGILHLGQGLLCAIKLQLNNYVKCTALEDVAWHDKSQ